MSGSEARTRRENNWSGIIGTDRRFIKIFSFSLSNFLRDHFTEEFEGGVICLGVVVRNEI